MDKKKYTYKNAFQDMKFMISFVWKNSKALFALKTFEIILSAFVLIINTYSLKIIIDSLANGTNIKEVIIIIICIQVCLQILDSLETYFINMLVPRIEYKLRNSLQNYFISKAVKLDLDNYENTQFYDHFTKAMKIADNKALAYVDYVKNIISAIINLILISVIITQLNYYMFLFIVVIVVLTIIDQRKSLKYSSLLYDSEESINRRMNYIKNIAHDRKYAKEVRVFNLGSFLTEKLNISFKEKYEVYKKFNGKYWRLKYFISFFRNFILVIIMLAYISFLVSKGEISIGDFSLIVGAIFSTARYISDITNTCEQIKFQGEYYISHLKIILNTKSEIEEDNGNNIALSQDKIYQIEFRNVYFKYPEHDDWVLENISFTLEPGMKLAIVGKNGAGKSTIVKLMLRLYDVTKGEIFVNKTNIKDINVTDLRKMFSIVLQDFNIYSFTVAENILMNFYDESQKSKIENSLQLFAVNEYLKKYGQPENVYINRDFDENGIGLSGGQMQQLAISRALALGGNITLFDEPNSSLDPIAEFELNKKILSEINDKSVVFVTHRLSTAVMADRILLIDKGKIIEAGTHDELLSTKGMYFEMFEKQNTIFKIMKEMK